MVIKLVSFNGGIQEFIKIIIIGMSLILRMVIAQITKFLKVGFEVMDAFDLFSIVTSLKMFEKLKR